MLVDVGLVMTLHKPVPMRPTMVVQTECCYVGMCMQCSSMPITPQSAQSPCTPHAKSNRTASEPLLQGLEAGEAHLGIYNCALAIYRDLQTQGILEALLIEPGLVQRMPPTISRSMVSALQGMCVGWRLMITGRGLPGDCAISRECVLL